jgi:GTP-binding protein
LSVYSAFYILHSALRYRSFPRSHQYISMGTKSVKFRENIENVFRPGHVTSVDGYLRHVIVHDSMKIISAELHDQAFTPEQIPEPELPQIAVFGRSNVGKSSLLATMMRRKKLVKISSTPGKTRGIFYYRVNDILLLVDLPGYGFSKAPKVMAAQWQSLVEAYLDKPPGPTLAMHLIDIRHPPTADDHAVRNILEERQIPILVVATKGDKLSRSRRLKSVQVIAKEFDVPNRIIVPVSAKDASLPTDPVWESILSFIDDVE